MYITSMLTRELRADLHPFVKRYIRTRGFTFSLRFTTKARI